MSHQLSRIEDYLDTVAILPHFELILSKAISSLEYHGVQVHTLLSWKSVVGSIIGTALDRALGAA